MSNVHVDLTRSDVKRYKSMTAETWESLSSAEMIKYHTWLEKVRRGRKRQLPEKPEFARKFFLFACACVRMGWEQLPAVSRAALLLGEELIEGAQVDPNEKIRIEDEARSVHDGHPKRKPPSAYSLVAYGLCDYDPICSDCYAIMCFEPRSEIPEAIRLPIARDLFCNPLIQVELRPEWVTGTVRDLAQLAYDQRDFTLLKIIGDALEDAGCEDPHIAAHCRQEAPHYRGCWVLDLILGKT